DRDRNSCSLFEVLLALLGSIRHTLDLRRPVLRCIVGNHDGELHVAVALAALWAVLVDAVTEHLARGHLRAEPRPAAGAAGDGAPLEPAIEVDQLAHRLPPNVRRAPRG